AQEWLDGNDFGTEESFLGKREGLHHSSHAPVAVAKGVNRYQVEVRHRRAHHGVTGQIARIQPAGYFADKCGNFTCSRRPVGISAQAARHDDWCIAQSARPGLWLRVADEEMQVEDGLR